MESFLLLLAVILLAGVWSARVGTRIGVPVMFGFVVIGVLVGPHGLHLTRGVSLVEAKNIGYVALVLILFEGGLHTSWAQVRRIVTPALSLATVGVLVSAAILTVLTYYLLHLSLLSSALIGVAVSSTDAASVFSMLGGQSLSRRLVDVLEVESGANDPMAFFLTIVLIQWASQGLGGAAHAAQYAVLTFALQMSVGLTAGLAIGYLGSLANQRIRLDTGGLYPTLSLAFALLSYAAAAVAHGSGFLAVYAASMVMGSRRLEHRHSIMRFHEGLAWTMQILMFVVLGFQVTISHLASIIIPGLALALAALLIARPAAVWAATSGMGFSHKERHFLSWAGLRGAVPIVLILTAVLAQPSHASHVMIDAVFFVVMASTLIQGWTVRPFAERLSLLDPEPTESVLELVAIARENATVVPIQISPKSPLVNQRMVDLSFPENTLCYAIIRDDRVIVPRGATRLRETDHLLVLSDRRHVDELRQHFAGEILGKAEFVP